MKNNIVKFVLGFVVLIFVIIVTFRNENKIRIITTLTVIGLAIVGNIHIGRGDDENDS